MPPVQVNEVAAGVQLAVSVAVPPAMTEVGDALRVQTGAAAPIWHACQFTPVAVFQAVSVAETPLDVRLLVHRVLCPAVKVAGGVGTAPVNWLLSTRKANNAGSPLSDGIAPVKRLLWTRKSCSAVNPLSDGIGPVNWLLRTLKNCNAVSPLTDGIAPFKLLRWTRKSFRAVKPLSDGSAPLNWLLNTSKNCSAVKPLSGGIVPVNWLPQT